jgi:hypothetical protein
MNPLDNLIQGFAWSIIVIPVLVLIIGSIASYFLPKHRKTIGISLLTLGALGTGLFALTLIIGIVEGLSRSLTSETFLLTVLLVIELITLAVGALSLKPRDQQIGITNRPTGHV